MSALGLGAAAAVAGASMLAGFLVGVYAAEKDREAREDRFRARLEELGAGRDRARDTAVRLENELARSDRPPLGEVDDGMRAD